MKGKGRIENRMKKKDEVKGLMKIERMIEGEGEEFSDEIEKIIIN